MDQSEVQLHGLASYGKHKWFDPVLIHRKEQDQYNHDTVKRQLRHNHQLILSRKTNRQYDDGDEGDDNRVEPLKKVMLFMGLFKRGDDENKPLKNGLK